MTDTITLAGFHAMTKDLHVHPIHPLTLYRVLHRRIARAVARETRRRYWHDLCNHNRMLTHDTHAR